MAALKTSEDDPYAARLWYSQVYTALHAESRPKTVGKLREALECVPKPRRGGNCSTALTPPRRRAEKARRTAEALWGNDLRESPFDYEHRRFAKMYMRVRSAPLPFHVSTPPPPLLLTPCAAAAGGGHARRQAAVGTSGREHAGVGWQDWLGGRGAGKPTQRRRARGGGPGRRGRLKCAG